MASYYFCSLSICNINCVYKELNWMSTWCKHISHLSNDYFFPRQQRWTTTQKKWVLEKKTYLLLAIAYVCRQYFLGKRGTVANVANIVLFLFVIWIVRTKNWLECSLDSHTTHITVMTTFFLENQDPLNGGEMPERSEYWKKKLTYCLPSPMFADNFYKLHRKDSLNNKINDGIMAWW